VHKYEARLNKIVKAMEERGKENESVEWLIAKSLSLEADVQELSLYIQQLEVFQKRLKTTQGVRWAVDQEIWGIFARTNTGTDERGLLSCSKEDRERAHQHYHRHLHRKLNLLDKEAI
jgi:hypothetical protein